MIFFSFVQANTVLPVIFYFGVASFHKFLQFFLMHTCSVCPSYCTSFCSLSSRWSFCLYLLLALFNFHLKHIVVFCSLSYFFNSNIKILYLWCLSSLLTNLFFLFFQKTVFIPQTIARHCCIFLFSCKKLYRILTYWP